MLEEVTVTARRYEENLQDVPASVSAMSDEYLETQRVSTVDDVVLLTPNASFIRFNKIQPEYNFRGINANAEGSSLEAAVVTYIDNISISKDILKNPAMYDMERVEILRGPQGTSFGRNASAGVVHMITKRPTREFEAGLTASGGSHELAEVEAYISGPLTETLSGRVAAHFSTYDGYIEDASDGNGLDGQENRSVRGSLLFEPNDDLSIYFKAEYNEDDDESPVRRSRDCNVPQLIAGSDAANRAQFDNFPVSVGDDPPPQPNWPNTFFDPCDEFETEISDDATFFTKREMINLAGEIMWRFADGLTLTAITGYVDGETDRLQDAQGTPQNVLWQRGIQDAEIFSQEIRVDNHASGNRLRWLAGAFYLSDEQSKFDENQFFQNGAAGRPDTRDTKISFNETESFGIFGELSYDITDRLNATAGVRWAGDDKEGFIVHTGFGWGGPIGQLTGCNFNPGPPGPTTNFICGDANNPVGFADPVPLKEDWDDIMFKASLQYDISPEHMVYFLFSQGYKAGGFQPEPPTVEAARLAFNEESVDSFEIGWKGEIGGRLRVGLTGFYMEYDDLQLSQFIQTPGGFFQLVGNAGGVESLGVELEFSAVITPHFRINGSFGAQDVELASPVDITGDGVPNPETDGIRPDNAPKWTAAVNAEYDFPLPGGSMLTLRGDYRGRSNVWDDIINRERLAPDGVTLRRLRPAADIFGARLTWTSVSGKLRLSLWAENLFEEEEILNIGPPQPNTTQNPVAFGKPRTFGGTINYRY